jgi:exopolyphosphatase/guanosine-5'-triphosphate,3'-diphosphate pyrophosphatase
MLDGDLPFCRKESLIRIPLRLGEDAFSQGRISDLKIERLTQTVIGFKHLITVYDPLDMMVCATSAMREAENGDAILATLQQHSGLRCQIIDGKTEADLIYANHAEHHFDIDTTSLYIDVGGGSTELTLFTEGRSVLSQSFDIGTIRLLQGLVTDDTWKAMKTWIKQAKGDLHPLVAIGSGGNINKISKFAGLSKRKDNRTISFKKFKQIYQSLRAYTFEERVHKLAMRPDRADVIIPACEIYLSAMKWAQVTKMHVPQIGLVDGMVHVMYKRYTA